MAGSPAAVLGVRLRARREQLGLSLDDVETSTKIRVHYLAAIEAGQPTRLPGPVYAVGFARSYAESLGLSGDDAARELRMALGLNPDIPQAAPAVNPALAPDDDDSAPAELPAAQPPVERRVVEAIPSPRPSRPKAAARTAKAGRVVRRQGPQRPPAIPAVPGAVRPVRRNRRSNGAGPDGLPVLRRWLIVILVLALAGATYLAYSAIRAARPVPDDGPDNGEIPGGGTDVPGGGVVPPALTVEDIEVVTDTGGRLELVVDWDELAVTMTFQQRVWLQWEVDGDLYFEGFAGPLDTMTAVANKQMALRLGRAKQTEIAIGGVAYGPAGPSDDSRTVIITRKP
jgi:transcriptional regulator with XRE-family HTH domain